MWPRTTTLTLSPRECEPGALPPVCAKCGAPATGETAVGFHWHPPALEVIGIVSEALFVLVAIFSLSRRTVWMPVCHAHAGVWNWGTVILPGTLVVGLPVLLLGFALIDGEARRFASALLLQGLLGMAIGFAVGFWAFCGGIRARLIDTEGIVLTGLHPDFVDAVENHSPEKQAGYDALLAARTPAGFATTPASLRPARRCPLDAA